MRATKVLLAALVVGTLAVGGCNSSKSSKGPSTTAESSFSADAKPTTVQQQLLEQRNADDQLTKDAALQLFALQYGDLPGVTVPSGTPGPNEDGNLAIANVLRYWNDLTDAQRSAIRSALELPATFTPGGPGKARKAEVDIAPYQRALDAVLPVLERRFGPLGVPINIVASNHRVLARNGAPAFADTLVDGGTCRIRVFPAQFPAPAGLSVTMTHEAFHCFQGVWTGGRYGPADWVTEGTAEYVGAYVTTEAGGSTDATVQGNLVDYYSSPGRSLFRRAYDAFGFWAYVQQSGIDVFARLRSIVTAPSSTAAFAAIGGSGNAFNGEWASTQVDRPGFGNRWVLRGVGVPAVPDSVGLTYRPLANGQSSTLNSRPYATARVALNLRADLTRFESSDPSAGFVHMGTTDDRTLDALRGQPYCTAEDSRRCVCPPGTPQAGRTFPQITGGDSVIVVGAGASSGSVTLRATSLEDECGRERACPVGRWKMNTNATGLPFTVTSGGTGKVISITAEGALTQSFAEYAPLNGTQNGATFVVTGSGQITGRIAIPSGVPQPQNMRVTDPDTSGFSGSERITFPDGTVQEISGAEFTSLAGDLAGLGRTATISCSNSNTLLVQAGGITETYQPA
ncbi:MAG: hypothetical protein ACOYNI_07490 [Acidimicrobiia bacterium]